MNKSIFIILIAVFSPPIYGENEGIHVYNPVPGLAASEFYSFRVRTVGSSTWLSPHAFVTRCEDPALFTVDIDGQMDNQDTGLWFYSPRWKKAQASNSIQLDSEG